MSNDVRNPPKNLNTRSTRYFFVAYPDSCDINECISKVRPLHYAYILHDRDVITVDDVVSGHYTDSDIGTIKKPHYHIFMEFENKRIYTAIGKVFGLSQFLCLRSNMHCNDVRSSIRYMLHYDDIDKYQYTFSDIVTNFNIDRYFTSGDTDSNVMMIVSFIQSNPFYKVSDLIEFLSKFGLFGIYARFKASIFDPLTIEMRGIK